MNPTSQLTMTVRKGGSHPAAPSPLQVLNYVIHRIINFHLIPLIRIWMDVWTGVSCFVRFLQISMQTWRFVESIGFKRSNCLCEIHWSIGVFHFGKLLVGNYMNRWNLCGIKTRTSAKAIFIFCSNCVLNSAPGNVPCFSKGDYECSREMDPCELLEFEAWKGMYILNIHVGHFVRNISR